MNSVLKNIFSQNKIILLGVFFPFFCILFFLMIHAFQKNAIRPLYDILFIENRFAVKADIQDGKAQLFLRKGSCENLPKLYRYSPKTGEVENLSIIFPKNLDEWCDWKKSQNVLGPNEIKLNVPDLKNIRLSNQIISPDGFRFYSENPSNRFFLFPLFHFTEKHIPKLVKGSNIFPLPLSSKNYFFSLGWVLPNE